MEKLLVTSNFSFSHSVFYPFGDLSAFFIEDCRLQTLSVWISLKFVVWERVNKDVFITWILVSILVYSMLIIINEEIGIIKI